jgi:hypothetical protein
VTQQRRRRGAWVSLGRSRRANWSLRNAKVVDAPNAVLTLLGNDDQRFWNGRAAAHGVDRDTSGDATVAQALDL